MRTLVKSLVLATFLAMFVGVAPALAASPILSASYQGGSNLQISISNANSYSSVNLYTRQSSSLWTTVNNIGQTDGNGYFNQSISMPGDGSSNPLQLYVTVGGLQSSTISVYPNGGSNGCSYNCGTPYGLSLSQNSLSLASGQSASVNVYNAGSYLYGNYYISSNSNSAVASANISGSSVTVYGITSGSTSISICSNSSGSGCASLYVTVNGSSNCTYYNNCNVGGLVLSQTSLNLTQGQSSNVTVSSGVYGGTPYISGNSNSSVASASVSGNTVYVNGLSSGNTNISVCQNSSSACATLYVTVSGNNNCYYSYSNCGGSGSLSLSQTSLSLNAGQSSTVTVYGSGGYYISSNSNSAVASASISGSSVYLSAIGNGSSTITICQSYNGSQCATLYVTVSGNSGNTSVYFSPSSINIALAQSASVNIYSNVNGSYYVSSNSNSSIVSASISGNTLYLYGSQNGSASISVCQSGYSGCGTLYVNVGNGSGSGNCAYYSYSNCGNNSTLSLSQSSLSLAIGQSSTVIISGNGSYYVASNSSPYAVSASVSGNSLYISAINTGSSNISICQNSYNTCATLYVTVNSNYAANVSLSQTSLNLSQGQTATVNIFGSTGYGYYVSSNSNPGAAVVSQSGSVLSVYGSQSGSSTIQVCQNSASSCATLYVTVGGGNTGTGTGCYSNCGGVSYPGGTGGVLGASTYRSGELINSNGTIYIVYKNEETGFASSWAFTGLGFSFSNVVNVGASGLSSSGYTVSTAYGQHPWGSWIKSGQTVYFVHQSGLIPVPNWSTFLNNGGQAPWIVPANSYDFSLPIMAPMTNNDSRLQ